MWEPTVWPSNGSQWVGVIGLGLGPVGIAFFTWDYGVKHGNIQLLGTLAYSAPLISVVLLIAAGFGEATVAVVGASILIVVGSLTAGMNENPRGSEAEEIKNSKGGLYSVLNSDDKT